MAIFQFNHLINHQTFHVLMLIELGFVQVQRIVCNRAYIDLKNSN